MTNSADNTKRNVNASLNHNLMKVMLKTSIDNNNVLQQENQSLKTKSSFNDEDYNDLIRENQMLRNTVDKYRKLYYDLSKHINDD